MNPTATLEATDPLVPTSPEGETPGVDPVQLSFGQQRLWVLDRFEPGRALYNIPYLMRMRGHLNAGALHEALRALVRRHETLRTTIAAGEGEARARILADPVFELPVTDLNFLPGTEREAELARQAAAGARGVFDLERDLPIRARLFRLDDRTHALLLVLHHIAGDGWSMGVLQRELGALYAAFAAGQPNPLPDLPVQYTDYAGWQREYFTGPFMEQLLEYWKKNLAGAPALLELSTDHPRPPLATYRGAVCSRRLPAGLAAAARQVGRQSQATLFMTLLAVFKAVLHRYTARDDLVVGTFVAGRSQPETEDLIGFFVNTLALRTDVSGDPTFAELVERVRRTALGAYDHQELPFERLVEELQPGRNLSHGPVCQIVFTLLNMPSCSLRLPELETDVAPIYTGTAKFDLSVWVEEGPEGLDISAEYALDLFEAETIQRLLGHFEVLLRGAVANPHEKLSRLPLLTAEETDRQLHDWNGTAADFPRDGTIPALFGEQVRRTPDAVAVVFENRVLTYRELETRAAAVARRLRRHGVGPDVLVGLCTERSLDLIVGLLGILKAGGAYLPLDPAYPAARIAFMLEDAQAPVVLTQSKLRDRLPATAAAVVCLDESPAEGEAGDDRAEQALPAAAENLAYVIYTSGSTGRPKGVMLTHRNVVNFFAGMDRVLGPKPGVWLAVTSISFDISVLELFWTLTRGFKVVILSDEARIASPASPARTAPAKKSLDFSLFYFADSDDGAADKYRLLLEGAKFADRNGFKAIWTPERHFHSFGGLYPNPAVIGAALAQATQRISIRAGSVVSPLHHPLRIAEEWSVVDHLSHGRVALSFASGWHDRDFTLAPGNYPDRAQVMLQQIEVVRRLWRGEEVEFPGVGGKSNSLRIYPKPLQPELPVWLTSSGNPKTFEAAGRIGANLLTHLLGQSIEQLAGKIRLYREARRAAGHDAGWVTLGVHTFLGEDDAATRARARQPFCNYLLKSMDLLQGLAQSLYPGIELKDLGPEERQLLAGHAFDHHFNQNALLGSPERNRALLDRLAAAGVDEIACLIDFGVETDAALAGLRVLAKVQEEYRRPAADEGGFSLAEQVVRHGVTHLQCTPSHARLLAQVPDALQALRPLRKFLVGGEALPGALAQELAGAIDGEVINMYGPTETTVWSATHSVVRGAPTAGTEPVGRPIANTRIHLVDAHFQLVPAGVPGEVLIGGEGLARGYLRRPELTAERFVAVPFLPGEKFYRTGDLGRFRPDGAVEFLGRIDQQVKLRGHRIELGEIEAALGRHPSVAAAVALVREDTPGDPRLAAYVVPAAGATPDAATLREFLKRDLPEYMVPSAFVVLSALPLTPNGKVDRKALPVPERSAPLPAGGAAAPRAGLESTIAAIWSRRLGVPDIGRNDNFFELGGHSLLVVQVQAQLQTELGVDLPLVKLFQYPTVTSLAGYLAEGLKGRSASGRIQERARRQRAALAARTEPQPEAVA